MKAPPPPPHALEIRVHGVHGTSPNSMLGVEAKQVAGDALTGIFRSSEDLPYRTLNLGHAVEAYSWGSLTSGVQGFLGWVRRVLWLTLLPFAFVNVAYWARFHLDTVNSREARVSARTIRTAALLLTCLFVLTPCLVFIDLVAWQCFGGNANGCPRLPDWLDFLARFNAAQRMVIASVMPLGFLAILWALSLQSAGRYEAVEDTPVVDAGEAQDPGLSNALRSREMWKGAKRCRRLQHLHIGLGLGTIAMFSGFQILTIVPDLAGVVWATTGLAAGAWALAFARAVVVDDTIRPLDTWLPRAACLIVAMHLLALWFLPVTPSQEDAEFSEPFRNNNFWFLIVIVGLLAMNTVLFLSRLKNDWIVGSVIAGVLLLPPVLFWLNPAGIQNRTMLAAGLVAGIVAWAGMLWWHLHYRDDVSNRHESAAWRGSGPAVLLGAGAWIGLLFSSAALIGAADYLNGSEHPVSQLDTALTKIEPPDVNDEVTVNGDIVIAGAVLLSPVRSGDPVLVLGGELRGDSANGAGALAPDLFDETVLPIGTTIMLGEPAVESPQSVVLVDSCVRSKDTAACRPSSDGFVAQASYELTSAALEVAERSVTLSFAEPPQRPLIVPQVLTWTPLIQLLWIVLLALLSGLAVLIFWRTAGKTIRRYTFPGDGEIPIGSRLEVGKHRVRAALAHRAETLTDIIGALTTLLGLLLLVGAASGKPPWQLLPFSRPFTTMSLYAAVGSSLLLVLLGSYLRRSESTRKAVGVLWDLSTFWPRAAHPLAPPCYAERVVPELTTRIRWALDKQALVVLSGHSQGSLIAVAVAARLEDDELQHLRLVTYGSQIRALYGRVFPAVFGPRFIGNQPTNGAPTLRDGFPDIPPPAGADEVTAYLPTNAETLRARIGPDHWINLFRRTDPLGYRVFTDYDSDHDQPVREVPVEAVGDPGPRIGGHSGYQHTPEYRRVVGGWLREEPVGVPPHVTPVPPLPLE